MDSTKENDLNTIVLDHVSWDQPNGASDIFISDFDSMITATGQAAMPTITIGNGGTSGTWDTFTLDSLQGSNTITLDGEDADVVINGESLVQVLRALKEHLAYLQPNPELESEWAELRDLGDRYRALEAQLKEKTKMWNTIKQMPPPEIS